jgi:hypothetical protein
LTQKLSKSRKASLEKTFWRNYFNSTKTVFLEATTRESVRRERERERKRDRKREGEQCRSVSPDVKVERCEILSARGLYYYLQSAKTLSIMAFSIMIFGIMAFKKVTFSKMSFSIMAFSILAFNIQHSA